VKFWQDVGVRNLLLEVDDKQLRWFSHVKRMNRTRMWQGIAQPGARRHQEEGKAGKIEEIGNVLFIDPYKI
jgi:hypothetical protein